ncbi:hypothetical protein C8A05DRAFT_19171 [Staphylotrichum tortipilum]|uniref:Uncharacterized protein n=1 Tax=Staphylotrichum tortipilum TaxID=2831512 RepID=A0AAN6MDT2_9PEZI|nr:hypothetical protein C8A05DRAFT_19171 [Staphylotrichum longicolle]
MEPPIDRAEVSDDRHQDEPLGDDNQDELSDDEVDDQDALLDDRDEWGDLPSNPFNNQTELFDDQAFWFLALLDQREYHRRAQETTARPATRAEVAGIALPRSQFVSLRLCCPGSLARRHREVLNSTRLIFTRSRPEKEEGAPVGEGPQAATVPPPRKHVRLSSDPAPSWALRADDRRTTNLKPRKKQKLADVFSGFGM